MTEPCDEAARHRAFARRGASWRRMLMAQPPQLVVGRVGGL